MSVKTKDESVSSMQSMDLRLPSDIKPNSYSINIILKESSSKFTGYMRVSAEVLKNTDKISLHRKDMNFTQMKVYKVNLKTQKTVEVDLKDNIKTINSNTCLDPMIIIQTKTLLLAGEEIFVDIWYNASISDDMAGFYRSKDNEEESNSHYIYSTQFEATSARLAFPCWDEPEFKAVFNISITAPTKFTVLSNSSLDIQENHSEFILNNDAYDSDVLYTTHFFKPTPVMSTYLVAWVIGDLEFVEKERIKVYTPKGLKKTGEFSLDVAVRCLKYFEDYFGVEYQMEKLDMVAIPNFSAGAMENWGLVTYRSSSLLYREGSTTEIQKLYIAETVCHELAHQWFGNLVTMKWWNDLWLNEGFATWAGTLATAAMAKDINLMYDPWENFLESDISRGMKMDGKLSTHPINMEVNSTGEISSIFDAISYSKGASMIQMLSKYIGENNFKEGLQKYIKKYMYMNTETKDLWSELDKKDRKISEPMSNWINTKGFPRIRVEMQNGSLFLKQTRYLPLKDTEETKEVRNEQWMIFLTKKRFLEYGEEQEESILFSEKEMKLDVGKGFIMFNVNATGFYLMDYSDDVLHQHIIPLLESDLLTQLERYGIFRDIIKLSIDGHRNARYALDILKYIKSNEKAFVVGLISEYLEMLFKRYRDEKEIKLAIATDLSNLLQKYLDGVTNFDVSLESNEEKRKLRIIAVNALSQIKDSPIQKEICRLAETNKLSSVHKDYKLSMYISYAKFGGSVAYEYLYAIIKSKTADENEKLRAISAISYSNDEVDSVFKLFSEKNQFIKNQDKIRMVAGLAQHKDQKKTLKMFINSFAGIVKNFSSTKDNVARFVEVFIALQLMQENIEECMEFFSLKENIDDSWKSAIKKGYESSQISYRFYKSNIQSLKEWANERSMKN